MSVQSREMSRDMQQSHVAYTVARISATAPEHSTLPGFLANVNVLRYVCYML